MVLALSNAKLYLMFIHYFPLVIANVSVIDLCLPNSASLVSPEEIKGVVIMEIAIIT